jgi:hypothetical protein
MKWRVFAAIFLLCSFSILNQSCTQQNENIMIEKMKMVSIDWDIVTRNKITPESIWALSESYTTTITDSVFLENFGQELAKIKAWEDNGNIDVRISCLLYRYNNEVDTLSFGRINILQFNDRYAQISMTLLNMILSKLPPEQQKLIPSL